MIFNNHGCSESHSIPFIVAEFFKSSYVVGVGNFSFCKSTTSHLKFWIIVLNDSNLVFSDSRSCSFKDLSVSIFVFNSADSLSNLLISSFFSCFFASSDSDWTSFFKSSNVFWSSAKSFWICASICCLCSGVMDIT